MNSLPLPDYTDYFRAAAKAGLSAKDILFPIEASRGCWWGERHHCIFCGLNGADMRHRMKTPDRVFNEIRDAHLSYGVRRFAFTDNILSPKLIKPLLPRLHQESYPVSFEAEAKSNLNRIQVQTYRRAGFTALQLGIESLSTRVLGIMNKGVTALANIAALKWCAEANIHVIWNLLYGFPGEIAEDFDKIMTILPAIVHLQPPMLVTPMTVTRFSPSFDKAEALGFKRRRPAALYRFMYPYDDATLTELVQCFDFDFDDGLDRRAAAQPIKDYVHLWARQAAPGVLVYDQDWSGEGRPALLDSRFNAVSDCRELTPLENHIFQLCDTPIPMRDLLGAIDRSEFRGTPESTISAILQMFVTHRFAVEDERWFLNVAMSDCTFVPWKAMAALDLGTRYCGASDQCVAQGAKEVQSSFHERRVG